MVTVSPAVLPVTVSMPLTVVAPLPPRVTASVPAQAANGLVAEDPLTRELLRLAARVAQSAATVLLTGESGSGKEMFARFVHDNSPRAAGPFIAINCAAIPENLLEATLFGHERGAFTGAQASQAGKFEQANGGTLLLDEISEMPLALQAKLLRVLQEREVERVGGRKPIALDIRILATTNRDPYNSGASVQLCDKRQLHFDSVFRLMGSRIEFQTLYGFGQLVRQFRI